MGDLCQNRPNLNLIDMDTIEYWKRQWNSVTEDRIVTKSPFLPNDKNDTPFELTEDLVKKAIDTWFPGAIMPKKITIKDEIYTENGEEAGGSVIVLKKGGKYSGNSYMNLSKSIIKNLFTLFYTLGHELVHVSQYNALKGELVCSERSEKEDLGKILDYYAHRFECELKQTYFHNSEDDSKLFNNNNYKVWIERADHRNFGWVKSYQSSQHERFKNKIPNE